ncbi:hypothetical protein HOY80DRAFT_1049959 [Tuber brumale]|nr:hypothetical protein HOY80DRAFT_1049959 [Tuber brumale]
MLVSEALWASADSIHAFSSQERRPEDTFWNKISLVPLQMRMGATKVGEKTVRFVV